MTSNAIAEETYNSQENNNSQDTQDYKVDEGKIDIDSHEYGLYMLYSSKPLNEIREFVESYSERPKDTIKIMRIDYIKNLDPKSGYKETNRTVTVMQNKAAAALKADGYDKQTGYDFVIAPYSIRKTNHPPKGTSYAFFISIPLGISNEEAQKQLHMKFEAIVDIKFLARNEYTISFPTVSREEDKTLYRGHAIVTFSNKVCRDIISRIKVILDMTRWYTVDETGEPSTSFCHIAYCRSAALSNLTNRRPRQPHTNPRPLPTQDTQTVEAPKVAKTLSHVPKPKARAVVVDATPKAVVTPKTKPVAPKNVYDALKSDSDEEE